MTDRTAQRPPEFLRRDAGDDKTQASRTELLLETHRVIGTLELSGPPRRLVDILNASDGPIAIVRDALVESLANPGQEGSRFDVLHIMREAILLAIPVSAGTPPARASLEIVQKRRAAATLMLPGLEVTGHIHLPPDADPGKVRLLGRHDFLPITEAEVTQVAHGASRWREPLVVVNLRRALLFAPAPR